ncbi:hypothetical protein B0T18DRAFT_395575, partial [Schizothecium vesticola]
MKVIASVTNAALTLFEELVLPDGRQGHSVVDSIVLVNVVGSLEAPGASGTKVATELPSSVHAARVVDPVGRAAMMLQRESVAEGVVAFVADRPRCVDGGLDLVDLRKGGMVDGSRIQMPLAGAGHGQLCLVQSQPDGIHGPRGRSRIHQLH